MTKDDIQPHRNLDDFAGMASDWFWETDAEHRFRYFSAKMEEVTKVDSKALIGKSRTSVPFADLEEPKWQRHFADLQAHRPFRNFEYKMRRVIDGSLLWIRIAGNPQFDAEGKFTGYRGTGHDITHEKVAMQRLEASNAALEERNRQLDELQSSLKRSAFEDPLTALANRRAFEHDLEKLIALPDTQIGLLHVDLDRFKWVNDTLGHPAGDCVLQTAASRIKLAVSDLGRVYRVGGDEFMVILRGLNTQDAKAIGIKIVSDIMKPIEFGQRRTTVGASIGIAVEPSYKVTMQRLIGYADAALYEAKRGGRNAVCMLDQQIKTKIDHHRQLASDIVAGLEKGELLPHFQPQMDTETGQIIGVEALVRWQHREKGLLTPADFFPAALEQGLMERIDRLILEKSIGAVMRIRAMGLPLGGLSVNLSEARLVDPKLPEDVYRLWTDRGFALSLELLETIYFDETHDSAQSVTNIARLRRMGVRIETDDFGSGRASLTGLLKIRPDRLKIDRCLIKEIVTSSVQRNMVTAILDMAQALGIDCIAEGVETAECIDAIQSLGCFHMQGYAISRPLDEAKLIDFLQQHPIRQNDHISAETTGHMPRRA